MSSVSEGSESKKNKENPLPSQQSSQKPAPVMDYLLPPAPVRQYLISPPASPPVGWEPREEGEPIINYDIISALSKLTPGCAHELHPPSEAHPGIVVHVCGDDDNDQNNSNDQDQNPDSPNYKPKIIIQQTKRPPLRSSSEGSEDSTDSLVQ